MMFRRSSRSTNDLTGTLPPEFGPAWPGMAAMALNNNSLSGPLPKEWSQMTSLRRLFL